jgi:hypothetical protein
MRSITSQEQAVQTAIDRCLIAHAKNPNCVVCETPIEDPTAALLLPQNERLAHVGACSAEALKKQFAFARRGLKGARAMWRHA